MNPYISIIIPVYNAELYIEQCLNSIYNQTYTNYEIILVDDGSTDQSPKICDSLSQKNNQTRVIHKKNGGAADSRNVGLSEAKGEYVIFVDSDDFWSERHCLEKLIAAINTYPKSDFIGFNLQYYWNDNKIQKWPQYGVDITGEKNKDELINKLIKTGSFPVSPCTKIIKHSFLKKYNINFYKGIVGEDILWFQEILEKAKEFHLINEYLYNYRKSISTSVSGNMNLKKFNDFLFILEKTVQYIPESSFTPQSKRAILSFTAYNLCILLGEVRYLDKQTCTKKLNTLKEYLWLLDYDLNPKVKKCKLAIKLLGLNITSNLLYQYISKYLRR